MTYKVFEAGETLSANDVMTYFMNQMVTQEATYADLADLPADIKVAYVLADDTVYALLGSTWTPLAYSGEDFTVGDLVVNGDLTVSGTTTTLNTTTLDVEDKNIHININGSTDASADGAGLTICGYTEKTFNWVDATDAFTSSEHLNLASGKAFKLNGTDIKDVTQTLTNKTISGASNTLSNIGNGSLSNSSISIDGTSVSLGGSATIIPSQTGNAGKVLTTNGTATSWATDSSYSLPSQTGNSGKYLTTNGTAESWGTISTFSAPTLGSTSITSGSTVTTVAGLTLTTPVITNPKITLTVSAKTAAYTAVSGDEGGVFSMNNASPIQFNIPTDATFNFAIGTQFNVFWITGAGQPTIGAVTPNTTTVISTGATSATPKLRVANSMATALKIAANSWIVTGDIS